MTFCPICYKQIEKEIWKKENKFKEIRWVFCPNHGYVKDDLQRTSLNAKIQAAKKRRIHSVLSKRPSVIQNKHVFILSKGLIISCLCMIVFLCAAFGYFVGVNANSHKDITYMMEEGSRTQSQSPPAIGNSPEYRNMQPIDREKFFAPTDPPGVGRNPPNDSGQGGLNNSILVQMAF